VEDGRAFVERGRGDRHQFRFIVSAEEGVELSDSCAGDVDWSFGRRRGLGL
jgi:hypothetical protein